MTERSRWLRSARSLWYGGVAAGLSLLACERQAPQPPATAASDTIPSSPAIVARSERSDSGPLYIVDGQIADNLLLADAQSLEIESMQVLNGAPAEARYGERGKNGVVLITTKQYAATLGTMRGTVLDASGKPLADARVVIVGTTPVAVTDSAGVYSLSVPAGTYTVRAESGAFKPTEMAGVRILAGDTLTADFMLADGPTPP
jgi:TonB-dependent SusC/RagA subfamily outer membrane receptor